VAKQANSIEQHT